MNKSKKIVDLSRGVPCKEQLDLSMSMLTNPNITSNLISCDHDYRNYGTIDGIKECKRMFGDILEVSEKNVFVFGNSSLKNMFDCMSKSITNGVCGEKPWKELKVVKWLCPVPGYDRHFSVCEHLGIEMINIPLNDDGPDMDLVERYIKDPSVKGIWCVPKYSNPTGITYSDEIVKRLARIKPSAKDFRIYWDNAYCIHDLYDNCPKLLNIFDECNRNNNQDLVYIFTSTSKITFPGGGISALACSDNNYNDIKYHFTKQIINFDKINQLRHASFLKNYDNVSKLMKKHADILRPKFELVENFFRKKLSKIAKWTNPLGGYFITLYVDGIAKEVIDKCFAKGVILTEPGATFPYHLDSSNSVIRIAPSGLSNNELEVAINILCDVVIELTPNTN